MSTLVETQEQANHCLVTMDDGKANALSFDMLTQLNAALDAARTLGRPVDIASWRHADQLPSLFNGVAIGTRILA